MTPHQPRSSRRLRALFAGLTSVLLGCLAVAAAPAVAAPTALPASNAGTLILHYDFDGDLSAGVVTDTSASGLGGTLVNPGSATQTAGVDGSKALSLPGGSATSTTAPYVQIPNGLFKGRSAVTISTWFQWAGGPDFQWLYNIGKDQGTGTFLTPSFEGDSKTRASIKPVNGGAEVGVSGTGKLPTGTWLNAVTTIDGQTITYYLNGAKVGSQKATIDLAATMYSAANTTSGFLGKAFWGGHPFLAGAIDDFRVYDTAFTGAQVAALAGDRLATPTGVSQTSFDVQTTLDTPPSLPDSAPGTYSDGIARPAPITWDAVPATAYGSRGRFTVKGIVKGLGTAVTANVEVTGAGDLAIDLGKRTGAFHGGASGVLYGLYGDGVPSRNLIEGMKLRTVSTKAQDGPQHPGADALEVVKPLADTTDGHVYIYMTDIYRGFPYQWPGSTPQAKLDDFKAKIAVQVDQVRTLEPKYQDNIVFVPFNEPEGNMFGTGDWSYNKVSWLSDPQYYFKAWDEVYALIKGKMPNAKIAGPNSSVLFDQVRGFLAHTVAANTVPDVMTWHELFEPASVRTSVAKYRGWENEVFAGTARAGKHLPINITEYAFNYHTSVPGQMIQWVSAIEDAKVDADIAYWNIDGNLSDSAVQANRGNGQWWLLNAYGQLSGDTVKVTPPKPGASYTMQGVATLDDTKRQARAIFGGSSGGGAVVFTNIDGALFGDTVHALVQEIPWTGQLGDSTQPRDIGELTAKVANGAVTFDFGQSLPKLKESSAYQIILSPGANATATAAPPTTLWSATYEAEDAPHTGTNWQKNGPEGSPTNVGSFYTSGGYDVSGLRTGSDVAINFAVAVPKDGTYDLSLSTASLNTYDANTKQGPANVYVRVDGKAERELHLPLGYKWKVWDHTDTRVALTKGDHVITVAANSLDGTKSIQGDAEFDKIDLSLANPAAAQPSYEAEHGVLAGGAKADYSRKGSGGVALSAKQSVTWWVYADHDGEATLHLDTAGTGKATLVVNDLPLTDIGKSTAVKAFLSGGINKVTLVGRSGHLFVDRLKLEKSSGTLKSTWYEAENAKRAGTATVTGYTLASGGKAVTDVGGAPGNGNTLTFDVQAKAPGTYALTVRYSNPEQVPATHYNPDPLARPADIAVNGGAKRRVLFPHSFHANNFWELTVPVELKAGRNTVRFSSEELPDWNGSTYSSARYPDVRMRSKYAPIIDKVAVTPYVDAVQVTASPAPSAPAPSASPVADPTTDPLPTTGAAAALILAFGAALVAMGIAVRLIARRRAAGGIDDVA